MSCPYRHLLEMLQSNDIVTINETTQQYTQICHFVRGDHWNACYWRGSQHEHLWQLLETLPLKKDYRAYTDYLGLTEGGLVQRSIRTVDLVKPAQRGLLEAALANYLRQQRLKSLLRRV